MEERSDSEHISVKQEQVHDLIFGGEIGWQEIIYDLIHTEQLDPWDVDIILLTNKFIEKIQKYEEVDFFVSSKVLLAASLLLRIKSEFLLNKYVRSIDEILFGSKEKKDTRFERIILDEEIPELIPKSPMPRFRKVSLQELIDSLNKAITTENRRIKKEIINTNALRESGISLPKRKFDIKDKLKTLGEKLRGYFGLNKENKRISYTEFIGTDKEERLTSFFPLLQMENNGEIWLEQKKHFEEIHVWLKEVYFKEVGDPFAELREGLPEELNEEDWEQIEEIEEEIIEDEEKKFKKEMKGTKSKVE
jgi:segregation and condensation protein A